LFVSVDGNWSDWSVFGSCTVSCGGGNQTSHRECNNPAPGFGGKACEGAALNTQPCNVDIACPGNKKS
jgi:hypothetical protein